MSKSSVFVSSDYIIRIAISFKSWNHTEFKIPWIKKIKNNVDLCFYAYPDMCVHVYVCTLLKIENNSSWVNFTHFWEKTHLSEFEMILVSSSWLLYVNIKFNIWNERLEWCKKRTIFYKWTLLNNYLHFTNLIMQ